ncbi:MAG: glutathione S-transferase [Rhodobacteraceae bacterium]|nr:glutathione S-transferase [Paracoccaceae bacterium]
MSNFPLTVTAWTAVILGALMLWLTLRVVAARRADGIVLGDNDDRVVTKKIRGHANAAEQIPIALILLGFAELLQPIWVVLPVAALLVIGRILHGIYFTIPGTSWRLRVYGMWMTVIVQALALVAVAAGLLF